MKRVQGVALDLFEAHGFANVTVEQVASEADISAPTIYRHFGTKEGLVLWDEHDDKLLDLASHAGSEDAPMLETLTEGLVEAVGAVYRQERERLLRRTRLIRTDPTLERASAMELVAMRDGLAEALATSSTIDRFEAEVLAAAIIGALEVAIRQWERRGGRRSLDGLVRRALGHLHAFGDLDHG